MTSCRKQRKMNYIEKVNTFFLFFVVIVLWIVRLWHINTNYSRGFWEPYTTLGRQKCHYWGVRRPYDIWADCQSLKGFKVLWQQPQLSNNKTSSHSPDLSQTGDLSLFSSRILLSLFSSSPIEVVAIIINKIIIINKLPGWTNKTKLGD